MNLDFIGIKSLEGELKFSHKQSEIGMIVSTKEFVLQKPHANYHVRLEDIVSIVPFDGAGLKRLTLVNRSRSGDQITSVSAGSEHYRIHVSKAVLHNRSGIFSLGAMEFVLSVHNELLSAIAEYGELRPI